MPDISSSVNGAFLVLVGSDIDALDDSFGSGNLVRTHDKQFFFGGIYAISCEDIEERMFGKESCCEVFEIGDDVVLEVSPIGSEGE